jgi:large subunit ribosomal protein L25
VEHTLAVEPRDSAGRTGSRRLRREGKIPAIVYGGGKDPLPVVLDQDTLLHQMEREAFFTSILTLTIGKDSQAVVVKEVQRHPAKPQVLHLDFQRIVEDQEITLTVPIHFLGEEVAKGVKEQGGVVEHIQTDAEVSCLPRHLPEFLELDVSELELNHILHLSDIVLPEGVTLIALEHGQDQAVVAINPPRREEEDVTVEAAEEEEEGLPPTEEEEAAPAATGDETEGAD